MIIAVYGLNLVAFAFLARNAEVEDWLGMSMYVAALILELLVSDIRINTWMAGLAGVNLLLFLGLWYLAERYDRWWLFLGAITQLATVATHASPIFNGDHWVDSGIAFRNVLYVLTSVIFFVGAWEAREARRFAREGATKWDASGPLKTQQPSG